MARQRAFPGAGHQQVDVLVQVMVEGVGPSCAQRAPRAHQHYQDQRRPAFRSQEHAPNGGNQQQENYGRLG